MKEVSKMSEKQMKILGWVADLHVRYDVCLLLPTNHEQSSWSKRKFHPTLGRSHQL